MNFQKKEVRKLTEYFILVLAGIFIFLITGFDDMMVVFALIHDKSRKQKITVFAGTMLGAVIMLSFSFLFHLFISCLVNEMELIRETMKYLLFVPIIFALTLIYENIMESEYYIEKTKLKNSSYFLLSCGIYLTNMADDITLNTTYMVNLGRSELIIFLALGNLIGCGLMFLVADFFAKKLKNHKHKKIIMNITAVIIILLCLKMFFS